MTNPKFQEISESASSKERLLELVGAGGYTKYPEPYNLEKSLEWNKEVIISAFNEESPKGSWLQALLCSLVKLSPQTSEASSFFKEIAQYVPQILERY